MTRGLRNNNPGNIRHDGVKWRGEIAGTDKSFKTFETMAWGVRAMFLLLNNYQIKYGIDTIESMIKRWAPENENNTETYIQTVSKISGINRSTLVTTTRKEQMLPIIEAMIMVENGKNIPYDIICEGWQLFIKHK